MINTQQQNTQYKEVLLQANCQNIACLRSLSATAYATAEQNAIAVFTSSVSQSRSYGPVVDGYHVQNLFSLELAAGHFARVPMLVDDNGNEGLVFTPQNITTDQEFEVQVATLFTAPPFFFAELNAPYPDSPAAGPYSTFQYQSIQQKADYVYGDAVIQCPSSYLASRFAAAGTPGLQVHLRVPDVPVRRPLLQWRGLV